MRPKKLIMTAFGPYSDTQTVDFEELGNRPMFVITGPTGAGKTTIFDGIAFALYGDASGDVRLSENFKSQYAPVDRRCSVELTFEVHQKEYRVVRTPKQMKLGRDGSPRWENASATLILPDGAVVTGPAEVNPRIIALLGLTKEQFKKIVMLPQGEFRKLLLEKNDTKQEIFRKIFSTQLFEKVTKTLLNQAKELEQKLSVIGAENKTSLKSIDCGQDEILGDLLAQEFPDYGELTARLEILLEQDKQLFTQNNEELSRLLAEKEGVPLAQAEEQNRKFDRLDNLKREWELLSKQAPAQEERITLQERLAGCQKGYFIEQSIGETKTGIARLQKEQEAAKAQLEQVKAALAGWEQKSGELPAAEQALAAVREQKITLQKSKEQLSKRDALQKEREQLSKELVKSKESLERLTLAAKAAEEKRLFSETKETFALVRSCREEIAGFYETYDAYQAQKQQYEAVFKSFLNQQAAFLADGLVEDTPCPVCGSREHPAPAHFSGKRVIEQELNLSKKAFEELTRRLQEKNSRCRTVIGQLLETGVWDGKKAEEILTGCREEENRKAYFDEPEKRLSQTAGEQYRRLQELSSSLQNMGGALKEQEPAQIKELTDREKERQLSLEAALQMKDAALSETEASLQGISSLNELAREEASLKQQEANLEQQIKQVQEGLSQSRADKMRYDERIRQLTGFLATETQKLTNLREQFRAILLESGIDSNEQYLELKGKLSSLPELEKAIEAYRHQAAVNRQMAETLTEELKGKQRIDLDQLKEKREQLAAQYDAAFQKQLSLKSRIERNQGALFQLQKNQKEYQKIDQEYQAVGGLAKLANGNNAQRMSFERYVLASYFEDIVESANLRLSQMTNSRYELRRKEEKERHGKGSGLELEVFDSYTGKLRDVTTLSGGESFKASLSLALGLADIVSSYAGGVEINTMFIDEGFGTLDNESLDSAINALMQLQAGGRMIGIISHVPELKERIDAKLVVTPTKNGSTVHFEFH